APTRANGEDRAAGWLTGPSGRPRSWWGPLGTQATHRPPAAVGPPAWWSSPTPCSLGPTGGSRTPAHQRTPPPTREPPVCGGRWFPGSWTVTPTFRSSAGEPTSSRPGWPAVRTETSKEVGAEGSTEARG